MLTRSLRRGDTMIEVLFAVTIFSMVAVGGLTIMNQGAAAAQRSLEVTLVRHEIDAQAEALRLLYDDMIASRNTPGSPASATWSVIPKKTPSTITSWANMTAGPGATCIQPANISGAFVLNTRRDTSASGVVQTPAPMVWKNSAALYARVLYSGSNTISSVEGLWIEAARTPASGGAPGFIDFHIRACWTTIGQAVPMTTGTIVRLYEP